MLRLDSVDAYQRLRERVDVLPAQGPVIVATGPLTSALNGIGTAVGLYVLFELVFGLSLADGPLGF